MMSLVFLFNGLEKGLVDIFMLEKDEK